MSRRWRPSLGLVLGGALLSTLAFSFAGLVALRYLGPEIGFRNAAYGLAGLIGALTAGLGWLLLRLLLRPINALRAYAGQVRATPMDDIAPPAHFGTTELHATARSVIEMADTLRNRERSIRSFTDHVTHELKSPVTAIGAAAELLEDAGGLTETDRKLVAEIAGAGRQIERQLDALRAAARARESRHDGTTSLDAMRARLGADHPGLRLSVDGGGLTLPLSAEGLEIVLGHLIANAAAHGATRVQLEARAGGGGGARLTVSDDGTGISPGNRARIFEPFFTTRRETGGTGMGLTIAQGVVAARGGRLRHLPSARGAVFEIDLPGGAR